VRLIAHKHLHTGAARRAGSFSCFAKKTEPHPQGVSPPDALCFAQVSARKEGDPIHRPLRGFPALLAGPGGCATRATRSNSARRLPPARLCCSAVDQGDYLQNHHHPTLLLKRRADPLYRHRSTLPRQFESHPILGIFQRNFGFHLIIPRQSSSRRLNTLVIVSAPNPLLAKKRICFARSPAS
jgi:hypothetical protein